MTQTGTEPPRFTLFANHRRDPFDTIAGVLDHLDAWWILSLLVAAIVCGLWWSGRMVQAVYFGATMAVALVLNPLLKLAFSRTPPGSDVAATQAAVYAFPSGHTAVCLLVMYYAWVFDRVTFCVVAPIATMVIVSTIYLQYHYVVDLPAGFLLTAGIVLWDRAIRRRADPEPTLETAWAENGVSP